MKVKSICCSNTKDLETLINKWLEENQKTSLVCGKTIIDIKYNIAVAVSSENEITAQYWAMIHYK